jgi:hypothetical protein
VSSGECQTLRSICQVHRDCTSLILGVLLFRRSFALFCARIIPLCRSRTSFCCLAPLRRSDLLFYCSVTSFHWVLFPSVWAFGLYIFCRARERWYALEFDSNLTAIWLQLTLLTLPYAHVVLPCSCDSPILMRFSRAHDIPPRSWRSRTTIIDVEWRTSRMMEKNWIRDEAEGLTKLTKNLKQKNERRRGKWLRWLPYMRMRFFHLIARDRSIELKGS